MRELTPTESANVLNAKTLAGWSEEDALSYLDEFGIAKADAGLELIKAGMAPDDAVNTLRLDTGNQLLNPLVRSIAMSGYQRMEDQRLASVAQSLERIGKWQKASRERARDSR